MCVCAGVCGDQKRPSNSLELELYFIVSHPMWVLKPEPAGTSTTELSL